MMAIIRGDRPPRPAHLGLTKGLWQLIQKCWDRDRHTRPRMLEVLLTLNHPIHQRMQPMGQQSVTTDVKTLVSDIQQCLKTLDPPNEEYRPLLYALLDHADLKPHVNSLTGDDAQEFIGLLDRVSKADTRLHQC